MKHLAVFLAAAGSAFAADFATGQAARAVIGQPTFTAQMPVTSAEILGGVGGLAYVNGMLIVADSNRLGASPINNRVLIFRDVSQLVPGPKAEPEQGARCPVCTGKADLVLGQADFEGNCINGARAEANADGDRVCPIKLDTDQRGLRLPTGVASDGARLAVSDTDNNRVLIWNSIPQTSNAPADVVVGQPDFTSHAPNAGTGDVRVPSARSLRGPQGVWIQDGRLFVADTGNQRVLIWNSIPQQNFEPASLVLGRSSFSAAVIEDLTQRELEPRANTLLDPVSVTSDGVRLFVADLGHNRVLIWNTIPTQNQAPADIALGQPDLNTAVANNAGQGGVCAPVAQTAAGEDIYPQRCAATLDFPRHALSDGERLFVVDGGNDRVLVFNSIPTESGASADTVLGQINEWFAQTSDNPENPDIARRASADSFRTPQSLAWDGANLYVSDPFSRRIMVYSMGDTALPLASVRNAASMDVFAVGVVSLDGDVNENDELTITITRGDDIREYTYKARKDDTFPDVIDGIVETINEGEGDPWVLASPNYAFFAVILTSRLGGPAGNDTEFAATTSQGSGIFAQALGFRLSGGQDAARIAPGSLISIFGDNLAEAEAAAPAGADPLPTELGGVQLYVDGMRVPLLAVTPNQINAQLPFEVLDSTSASAYVRTKRADGSVTVTTAVGVSLIPSNPGIFAFGGTDPRPGVVVHGSSHATGTIFIEGTATAGNVVTVRIGDEEAGEARSYSYTIQEDETLEMVRDKLIALINEGDPEVEAFAGGQHRYIRLRARIPGPEGNGILYGATSTEDGSAIVGGTTAALCCANEAGALVTEDNPAVPGEMLIVYATGLGMINPDEAKFEVWTGYTYKGPVLNRPDETVSSLAGGKTANVLHAGMKPGTVGIYEVHLELNPDLPTNPRTQLTIAQDIYVSNIVTFPLVNPNPPPDPEAEP